MKTRIISFSIVWLAIFMAIFFYSCKKESKDPTSKEDIKKTKALSNVSARLPNGDYTCGDFLSGSYTGTGYYMYPAYTINVSSLTAGSLVQVNVDLVEIPNRFSIYDGGTLIATTGWVGYANYPGPWGSSLSTGQTTYVLSFPKSGTGIYTLKVETSTNAISDSWNASISCGNNYTPPPGCDPNVPCACGGGSFSGTYAGSGFHFYPDIVLNMQCTAIGHNVQISCSYLDVPNRFSVYDAAGNLVTTTGWVGNANYYGPWGSSLNTSYTPVLSFARSTTSAYYILRVETVRNTTYENRNDAWNVSTSCL